MGSSTCALKFYQVCPDVLGTFYDLGTDTNNQPYEGFPCFLGKFAPMRCNETHFYLFYSMHDSLHLNLPLCAFKTMTSQPVTFNNLNHKRVSSVLCWVLSLFIAIFHIARGRKFTAFSKNTLKDDVTLV